MGARGGHAAGSGHDGAGHWPGIFRAHPHTALQLPQKQRAPSSEHPLPIVYSCAAWSAVPPLRTRVLPGLQCLAPLQTDVFGCLPLIVDRAEGGGHAWLRTKLPMLAGREACMSAGKESIMICRANVALVRCLPSCRFMRVGLRWCQICRAALGHSWNG